MKIQDIKDLGVTYLSVSIFSDTGHFHVTFSIDKDVRTVGWDGELYNIDATNLHFLKQELENKIELIKLNKD